MVCEILRSSARGRLSATNSEISLDSNSQQLVIILDFDELGPGQMAAILQTTFFMHFLN